MAKNITIREGDTSKQFTAKKLKVNLVGGGTTNFIPEDEALDYVDVKNHEFKVNGTFNPSDFNCDAFGQVKVAVPANVKEKTITKNGVFNAASDNCLGYSKVTVNVPGGGGGGPYTVNFFGDDYETVLKTEANVPYGGSASCTELDGTILNGLYFKGWNPVPSNVRDNMNCYPVRGDYQYDANEIQDSWETICADGGAHYPLGSYKALVLTDTINIKSGDLIVPYHPITELGNCFESDINNFISCQFHMVKVAEGEDGSNSTWLSTGTVHITTNNSATRFIDKQGNKTNIMPYANAKVLFMNRIYTNGYAYDWAISGMKYILDNYLFPNLPEALKDSIKAVNKTYKGTPAYGTNAYTAVDKQSIDKLWVPSRKELHTLFTTFESTASVEAGEENTGIDYSSLYLPTYRQPFRVRTTAGTNTPAAWGFFQTVGDNKLYGLYGDNYNSGDGNYDFPIGFCL